MKKKYTMAELLAEEEPFKEEIYTKLHEDYLNANSKLSAAKSTIERGNFEDHSKHGIYRQQASAQNNRLAAMERQQSLYKKPYFARMQLRVKDEEENIIQFFLSESEMLDEVYTIDGNGTKMVIPFRENPDRPISAKIYTAYSVMDGKPFSVLQRDDNGTVFKSDYLPEIIRDVDILNRVIKTVVPRYPQVDIEDTEIIYDCDEMLKERLEEARTNAQLRNIISTLQYEQHQIIQTNIDTSFVVQGCAGSGKSQCMIHRLFYLRGLLDKQGREKVLLITPTKLFKNYASNLMRRFRLSDLAHTTLAEFYLSLLQRVDPRFVGRQYKFELTEEYLPDEYLNKVYLPENIRTIQNEISAAVDKYVREGCELISAEMPDRITPDVIRNIMERLTEEIDRYDRIEQEIAEDEEAAKYRAEIESADKELARLNNRLTNLEKRRDELAAAREAYDKLLDDQTDAETAIQEWEQARYEHAKELLKKLWDIVEGRSSFEGARSRLAYILKYSDAIRDYNRALDNADLSPEDSSHYQFLQDYAAECKKDLFAFLNKKTGAEWVKHQDESERNNAKNIREVTEQIIVQQDRIDALTERLQERMQGTDSLKDQHKSRRALLERVRYFLGRIESAVFEQEVWNALAPLKEACGIQTLAFEMQPDGHQKQSRILYKSDLLFYLMVYNQLHEMENLPDYRLLCIDEAQDLNSADFDMLRMLFPNAVMNVFGDLAQSLHVNCGISDWSKGTGIEEEYALATNYRNPADIVDFCNRKFGTGMQSVGKPDGKRKPKVITETGITDVLKTRELVVVVRGRTEFDELCAMTDAEKISYLDTASDKVPEGTIPCYSVFAAKGLEFPNVLVYSRGMNKNQKVVACTRAMQSLWYYE